MAVMLNAALSYAARGWSVLPLHVPDPRTGRCSCGRDCGNPGKHPRAASWKQYQSRPASEQEVRAWWARWPRANVGVVTGAVSGLVVVDLDGPDAVAFAKERGVPQTPVAATGKGFHVYFAHPGRPVPNAARLAEFADGGLDVRGDGGLVVAPPSLHSSGRRYAWARGRSPDDLPLASLPAWLLELLEARQAVPAGVAGGASVGKEPGWVEQLLAGVPEGQRDDAATRLAGHYLAKGLPEGEVLAILLAWNQKNTPPLSDRDIEKCVRSVARREAAKPSRPGRGVPAKGNENSLRLPGRVAVPEGWDGGLLVVAGDWESARAAYAAGHAVVVARPDGGVPLEAGPLLRRAGELRAAASNPEVVRRLEWLLAPLVYAKLARPEVAAACCGGSGGPAPGLAGAPAAPEEPKVEAFSPQEQAAEPVWEGDIEEVVI